MPEVDLPLACKPSIALARTQSKGKVSEHSHHTAHFPNTIHFAFKIVSLTVNISQKPSSPHRLDTTLPRADSAILGLPNFFARISSLNYYPLTLSGLSSQTTGLTAPLLQLEVSTPTQTTYSHLDPYLWQKPSRIRTVEWGTTRRYRRGRVSIPLRHLATIFLEGGPRRISGLLYQLYPHTTLQWTP